MGNFCSYESYTDQNRGHGLEERARALSGGSGVVADPFSNPEAINRLSAEISERFSASREKLARHPLEIKEKEILKEAMEYSSQPMQIFAEFEADTDGNKLQKYFFTLPFPFAPEAFHLFGANLTEEKLKQVDENIDSFSQLNRVNTGSEILSVAATRSKKIMVIEGRTFVFVKSLRRDQEGQLSEFVQSVSLSSVGEFPSIKAFLSTQSNVGTIREGATIIVPLGSAFQLRGYNHVNPLSGVGLLIVKPMVKKTLKTHFNKMVSAIADLLMTHEDLSGLFWLTSDVNEIARIFDENLKRMKNPEFKFKYSHEQIDQRIAALAQKYGQAKLENVAINPALLLSKEERKEKVPSRKESEKKEEVKVEEEKIPSRKESEKKEEAKVEEEKIPSRKESEKKEEVKVEEEKIPSRKESEKKEEEKIPSRKESEKKEEEKIPSRKESEKKEEEKIASRKESEKKEEEKIPSRKESEKKEEEEKIPSRKESEKKEEENESDLKETEANSEVVEGSSVSVPFTADSEIIRASEPAQEDESEAGASQEEKPSETFERQKTKKNKRKN